MKTLRLLTLLALGMIPIGAQACAVCAGGDNQNLIDASNSVLWTLLGLVAFIFTATGATVFFLWRKSVSAGAVSQNSLISPLTPATSKD